MQDRPLLISDILRRGQSIYGDSLVLTVDAPGQYQEATFTRVGERAEQLASALARLGVGRGDRVGTFCLNNQEHIEAYMAVPSMGAVLHTLNIRLPGDQLAYVINEGGDRVILVDALFVPALAQVKDHLTTVEHFVVVGDGDGSPLATTLSYEELLAAEEPGYAWPDIDEREASMICHTSGTTGDPKGVVYSHRSTWLHSLAITSSGILGIAERDRILGIVPMFHVAGWGIPYAAFMVGADVVNPRHFLQAEPLARMIADLQPTLGVGVPTIWNDLLRYAETHNVELRSLRAAVSGGAALAPSLARSFEEVAGVKMIQGWGMTETSPTCALAVPPKGAPESEEFEWRLRTGRVVPGVEIRLVGEDDTVVPHDGKAVGEIEVRGPWITGSYLGGKGADRFHDGWLRTGDVGSVDRRGFIEISDRTKDLIKTGGEWISSVDLENTIMGDPRVFEAAVIAVPDPKWSERPLVCVVPKEGASPTAEELVDFLKDKVARWWLPERWAFVADLPKTSVGKFDKKALRSLYADGGLEVHELDLKVER